MSWSASPGMYPEKNDAAHDALRRNLQGYDWKKLAGDGNGRIDPFHDTDRSC